MQLYQAIPELLHRNGVRKVFGLFGSANVGWVAHGVDAGQIDWVGVRHEGTSVAAAVAYSKVTQDIGVASTTMGPGFANTVNSLAAALHDHAPVLLFVGQSPSGKRGGDFQQLNQREICEAIGVGFHEVRRADQLDDGVWGALEAVRWNGTPQVVSYDEALLYDEVTLDPDRSVRPAEHPDPDPESVAAVVDLLASADKPLILAGKGAELSGARDALLELAELTGALVGNTLAVNRFFSGHPRDVGVCGQSASPAIAEALYDVDAVVAVGASLNSFTTAKGGMFPAARVVQCEIDLEAKFHASSPELALFGDANANIRAVVDEWRRRDLEPVVRDLSIPSWKDARASLLKVDLSHDPARGLDLRDVLVEFDERLPQERIVLTDGGRAGIPVPALLNADGHRSWLTTRGYGSIGLGLPGAIGAAVAAPDRPIVLFCGDGGFMMSANELDTVRTHGLSVTVVIMNDEQYGSELKYLKQVKIAPDVARQTMPDVDLLARSFGGTGVVVRTVEELRQVEVTRPGIYLLDVRLDPEVDPANL